MVNLDGCKFNYFVKVDQQKLRLVVIAAIQIVIAYFFEEVFISRDWLWNFVKRCQRKRHKGKRFRQINEDVAAAQNWPYLNEKNETKI